MKTWYHMFLTLATLDAASLLYTLEAFSGHSRLTYDSPRSWFRVHVSHPPQSSTRPILFMSGNSDDPNIFSPINQTNIFQWPEPTSIDLFMNWNVTSNSLFTEISNTWNSLFPHLNITDTSRLRKRDLIQSILRKAASLSLKDYEWRSNYFRTAEAERRVEESLARLMGEEVTYIRPRDAPEQKIGPLGKAEKQLVEWLGLVIEEEGRRARMIESSQGTLIRPMDLQSSGQGGPLSSLEYSVVQFLNQIRVEERERVNTKTLRPKDLQENKRGPLGEAELKAVTALEEIRKSERLRMDQSRARGGDVVRPVDVPGVLGEMERFYMEVATAERQRKKESEKMEKKVLRPMESSLQGPLGIAEKEVSEAMKVLRKEEMDRLESIKRSLAEKRPMETNRYSLLGWTEAIFVGMIRAPALVWMVLDRVMELMDSSRLDPEDEAILRRSSEQDGQMINRTIEEDK